MDLTEAPAKDGSTRTIAFDILYTSQVSLYKNELNFIDHRQQK